MLLRILSFLSIEPGKQPLDQLNRRLRNRYVSVLPHADRGARYPHDLGEDRLGKFEPTPDGHQEGRFHVTLPLRATDRKSTRLNSSHSQISYAVFCLKKKKH